MSSSEEYLDKLLQSMMNGEAAPPSEEETDKSNDAQGTLEMLAGEESEQVPALEDETLDKAMSVDELLGELDMGGIINDDTAVDDMALSELNLDDMRLDEAGQEGMEIDSLNLDDIALEESALGDIEADAAGLEDNGLGDLSLDGEGLDELGLEDDGLGDLGLEGFDLDESGTDNVLDELSLDDINIENAGLDNLTLDDLELEEQSIDELSIEDMEADAFGLEDTGLDDLALEDAGIDEAVLDDIALEEHGFEDMVPEEEEPEDAVVDELAIDDSITDDIAIDESSAEDELSELGGLLDKPEQDEDIDDEMLALLESVSDSGNDDMIESGEENFDFLSDGDAGEDDGNENSDLAELMASIDEEQETPPPEDDKKKKKRIWKRKAKDESDNLQDGNAENDGSDEKPEKKPGAFARFLAFLTESEEDDEAVEEASQDGEISDENKELLQELSDEDKKKKDKKDKKDKKGKKKKGKKASAEGEEGEEGEEKGGKKKKPKKEKKVKPVDEEALNEPPSKKLSKKKVIPVILCAITITVVIYILSTILPTYLQKHDAYVAFDMGNYSESYDLLYGKDLNAEDEVIMQKSKLILTIDRKLSSYKNYMMMGNNELKALDALVQGVALYYDILPEVEQYNVTSEVRQIYEEILVLLLQEYGLSETDVIEIIAYDDVTYTQCLTSLVYGISFYDGTETEEQSGTVEDVLPEEQEIIDGLPENNL